jgi:hypothetical protein
MKTADALAPAVMPMMSGLASGLRASNWKTDPERPNALPTSNAATARGSRSVRTMKSASGLPRPATAGMTSRSGMGKSPTLIDTQNTTNVAATSTASTERLCVRPDRSETAPW